MRLIPSAISICRLDSLAKNYGVRFLSPQMKSATLFLLFNFVFGSPQGKGKGRGKTPVQANTTIVAYEGAGCPPGSVASSFAADLTSFTLIFDSFHIASGPGTSNPSGTKAKQDCQLKIKLFKDEGFTFQLDSAQMRGFAAIPEGVAGSIQSKHFSQKNYKQIGEFSQVFSGPFSNDYLVNLPARQKALGTCKGVEMLDIRSSLILTGDLTQPSLLTMDSLDGSTKYEQQFNIRWVPC